jgi:hypothetical protein
MSDHAPFYHRDIPFLFAFTGVHKEYHKPEDDWELINPQGAVRILMMFREIIQELDAHHEPPEFLPLQIELSDDDVEKKPAVEHKQEEAPSEAGMDTAKESPENDNPDEAARPSRPGVRLGIMPDVTGGDPEKPGMEVVSVVEGAPAKAAGIQARDRIVRLGDYPVKDIYGYMDALKHYKVGDTINVVVIRDEKEVVLKVKLEKSASRHNQE